MKGLSIHPASNDREPQILIQLVGNGNPYKSPNLGFDLMASFRGKRDGRFCSIDCLPGGPGSGLSRSYSVI